MLMNWSGEDSVGGGNDDLMLLMSLLTESMTSWVKEDGTDEGTVEDVDIEVEGIMYGEGVSFFLGLEEE